MGGRYLILILIINVNLGLSDNAATFLTQTVYGFLDFTTTIGNTVMVFSPQSAPTLDINDSIALPKNVIETKPITSSRNESEVKINPTKLNISVKSSTNKLKELIPRKNEESNSVTSILNNKTKKKNIENINSQSTLDSAHQIKNVIYKPEYDLLSRQPAEYAEETYRIVNLKMNSRIHSHSTTGHKKTSGEHSSDSHATGLVTKLSETILNNGFTTVHETSVIGTYISGKYAQLLQSSSNIHKNKKLKIRPTSSLRVLKTAAPVIPHSNGKLSHNTTKISHRQSSLSNRVKNKNSNLTVNDSIIIAESVPAPERITTKKTPSRSKSKRRNKSSRTPNLQLSMVQSSTSDASNRRASRTKVQSITETDASTSLYMFKLNRTPGRWQYKSSPKPRVTIRKQPNENSPGGNITASSDISLMDQVNNQNSFQNIILDPGDLISSGSQNGVVLNNIDQENKQKNLVETLNVEISTPVDFKDIYYEIATIKTPFTFQVGVLKKTRYITVTSTFEKVLKPEPTSTVTNDGPLTENILFSSSKSDNLVLDGSVTTLMPLYLSDDVETPNLETVTESYTITQIKLRTQILPIVRDYKNETTYVTLIQTYDVTSLITATKTLSPLEDNQFIPSKNFKDFGGNLDEAGSEINLELEFGDGDNVEEINDDNQYTMPRKSVVDISVNKNQPSSDVIKNLYPDQIKQLGLLNLYQPAQPIATVITRTHPVIKLETIWESHVVPIVNGLTTNYRTLSKSIGLVDKTEYVLDTTTISLPAIPPPVSVNPYLLPVQPQQQFHQQQFQPITSSIVHQTIVTQTNSKILKLTFGAKTAYTTVFSTEVIPTALTMFITTSMQIQPSTFPGYFPPPYPPFAYVG